MYSTAGVRQDDLSFYQKFLYINKCGDDNVQKVTLNSVGT